MDQIQHSQEQSELEAFKTCLCMASKSMKLRDYLYINPFMNKMHLLPKQGVYK